MAAQFPGPVSAMQVGSYFVSQYYQVIQQQPEFAHQFYVEGSTMVRVDGDDSETAVGMLQIHSLLTALNFTEIEIKTIHALDSWNDGVLVMISGFVQIKDFNGKRKFMQTFFLAPQEKGYFVLSDIFHFLDIEQIPQHHAILDHEDSDSKLNAMNPVLEPDSTLETETQPGEFVEVSHVEESEIVDDYSIDESLPQVPESDHIVEEIPAEEPSAFYPPMTSNVTEPQPLPVEEHVVEPVKHTYASILLANKGPARLPVPQPTSVSRPTPVSVSEGLHVPQFTPQRQFSSSVGPERSNAEAAEESTMEEGEGRSVYVRNLPTAVSASEIEQEFKTFGRIAPGGVVIRNRKDIGVCYAFIEFEDSLGVQNAIKASPIQFGGRQVHIEGRRANSGSSRGGRRGRGRDGYQSESMRGRLGRNFGRGAGGNGFQ